MHDSQQILTELAVAHQKLIEIGRDIAGIKAHLSTLNGKVAEHAIKFSAREALDRVQDVAFNEVEKTLIVLSNEYQQREGAEQSMRRVAAIVSVVIPVITAVLFFVLNRVFPTHP